jgi:1-acyl-sn-glycerol-3-phosphate acyltransferase
MPTLVESLARSLADPEASAAIDALPNRVNELGFDAWGFSPAQAKVLYTVGRKVYDYFRPVVKGAENVPPGRVLIVANHGGQLPYDGVVIAVSCLLHCKPPRLVRPMVERYFPRVPFVNELFARGGAVLGAPINCRNLLLDEQAILVFPEGARGSGKVWKDRYRLVDFGRGFMRLALQTNTPIVPVSVVGSEESIVSIHDARPLARLFKMPYFPISPLLPLLGPLAYVPLPTRFHVTFGAPLTFSGAFDDEDVAIDAKVAVVRDTVQRMVDEGLAARESIF